MASVFTYPVASSGSYSFNRSRSRVPLSGIKESLLDRSATNSDRGCFGACASMTNKDYRQYSERDNISSEKKKWKLKNNCHSCWSTHNWSTNQSKNQSQSWQWFCWLNLKKKFTSDWTSNWYWGKLLICYWKERIKNKKYLMMEGWPKSRQWIY